MRDVTAAARIPGLSWLVPWTDRELVCGRKGKARLASASPYSACVACRVHRSSLRTGKVFQIWVESRTRPLLQ